MFLCLTYISCPFSFCVQLLSQRLPGEHRPAPYNPSPGQQSFYSVKVVVIVISTVSATRLCSCTLCEAECDSLTVHSAGHATMSL